MGEPSKTAEVVRHWLASGSGDSNGRIVSWESEIISDFFVFRTRPISMAPLIESMSEHKVEMGPPIVT